MTAIRHSFCTTATHMTSWRSIATSLAVAAALLFSAMSTGCGTDSAEERALQHAADRLGVPEDTLRVTERTDLSTTRHLFLRVSARGRERQLTLAIARKGDAIIDGLEPDAFARLAREERLGPRFEELGGARVAGWFGALANGRPCGEPFGGTRNEQPVAVQVETLADGAHRLSYRFTDGAKLMRCRLTLDHDGTVKDVVAEASPVAKR
jgi:hypothetical protein